MQLQVRIKLLLSQLLKFQLFVMLIELSDYLKKKKILNRQSSVINRIRNHMVKNGDMLDVDEIVTHLSIDLIGIVADDDEVIKASNNGEPIVMTLTKGIDCLSQYCTPNSRRIRTTSFFG